MTFLSLFLDKCIYKRETEKKKENKRSSRKGMGEKKLTWKKRDGKKMRERLETVLMAGKGDNRTKKTMKK